MNDIIMPDRKTFLGGSDAAAILGVSKWKTPFMLYQEKIDNYIQESTPERDKVLNRGKRWEPVVVEMLMDELHDRGHEVEILARNARYQDPEYPFLACELDIELLVDGEEVNGEIKTVHPFAAGDWGEEDTDQIPIYYTAQVMHGLMIKPRRRTIVAALIGADDLRFHEVIRDDKTIAGMRAREIEFWDRIQNRIPPDPTTPEDVKWLYQADGGTAMEADEELLEWCQKLKEMKAGYKAMEAHIEDAAAKIKARLGTAAILLYQGSPLATWRNNKDSVKTDWEKAFGILKTYAPEDEIKRALEASTTKKLGARPFIIK